MNRIKLAVGIGMLVTFVLLTAACASTSKGPATLEMFRGDPEHTGVYQTRAVRGLSGATWSFKTDGRISAAPAVSGDLVYLGSDDNRLHALDKASGKERWVYVTGGPVRSVPAVVGKTVYVMDAAGTFTALDASKGTRLWEFKTVPQPADSNWDYFTSSPVVKDGIAYFGSHNRLYALDLSSHQTRWTFEAQGKIRSTPAVAEGRVYFGDWAGTIHALDLDSGAEQWRYETRAPVQGSAAVVDGVVYIGSRSTYVYALDALSGQLMWSFKSGIGWVVSSPAITESLVLIGSSDGKVVHGLDRVTGTETVHFSTVTRVFASPVVAEDVVYAADHAGSLYAWDLQTKGLLWTFEPNTVAPEGSGTSATVRDGVIYYPHDQTLYAVK